MYDLQGHCKGGSEMPGVSTRTKMVSIRVPVELLAKMEQNAKVQDRSLSNYIVRILAIQVLRKR